MHSNVSRAKPSTSPHLTYPNTFPVRASPKPFPGHNAEIAGVNGWQRLSVGGQPIHSTSNGPVVEPSQEKCRGFGEINMIMGADAALRIPERTWLG